MRSLLLALTCILLAGCAPPATWRDLDIAILSPAMGPEMLKTCSREPPALVDGFWRPSLDEIEALEAALPAALAADPTARSLAGHPPKGSRRQYVGLRHGQHRTIYGNFFPKNSWTGDWRRRPFDMCDGGPHFFGVEYEPTNRRIVGLKFNGEY